MELTKDAKKLLHVLYTSYCDKRKNDIPKSKACCFGGSPKIHQDLLPEWMFEDVDDTCRELSRAGLINCLWADNIAIQVTLPASTIALMENRAKNNLLAAGEFVSKFIP